MVVVLCCLLIKVGESASVPSHPNFLFHPIFPFNSKTRIRYLLFPSRLDWIHAMPKRRIRCGHVIWFGGMLCGDGLGIVCGMWCERVVEGGIVGVVGEEVWWV